MSNVPPIKKYPAAKVSNVPKAGVPSPQAPAEGLGGLSWQPKEVTAEEKAAFLGIERKEAGKAFQDAPPMSYRCVYTHKVVPFETISGTPDSAWTFRVGSAPVTHATRIVSIVESNNLGGSVIVTFEPNPRTNKGQSVVVPFSNIVSAEVE